MPVNGTLTQKVEILSEYSYKYVGDWEKNGTFSDTCVIDGYPNSALIAYGRFQDEDAGGLRTIVNGLTLEREGTNIFQLFDNKSTFAKWELNNIIWHNHGAPTYPESEVGHFDLAWATPDVTYVTSGTAIYKIDISELKSWSTLSYCCWKGGYTNYTYNDYGAGGGPTTCITEYSIDKGTTWTSILLDDYGIDGQVHGRVARFTGMTTGQDVTGTQLWIRFTFTTTDPTKTPYVEEMYVMLESTYKPFGTYTSKLIPLGDSRPVKVTNIQFYDYGTYVNPGLFSKTFLSFDKGITWERRIGMSFPIETSDVYHPHFMFKIEMSTTNIEVAPYHQSGTASFWSEIPVQKLHVIESADDVIKSFDFTLLTDKDSGMSMMLDTPGVLKNKIRITRKVGTYESKFIGYMESKPRTHRYLDQMMISVKGFDESRIATQYLINDSWPKWSGVETWDRVLVEAWWNWGPRTIHVASIGNYSTNEMDPWYHESNPYQDPRIAASFAVVTKLKAMPGPSKLGITYESLYELLEKFRIATGFSWYIQDGWLLLKDPTLTITAKNQAGTDLIIEANKNIVGVPQIDETFPEIANVIIVPIRNRQTGRTELYNTIQYTGTYYFQYKPLVRSFQTSAGATVFIDPPPEIWQRTVTDGVYTKLVAALEGTSDAALPTNQVVYSIENRWIKLKTNPTTGIKDGLKVIYTIEINAIYEAREEESIKLFGKRQHFISKTTDIPNREEAILIASNYLLQHAYPIQPVTIEVSEFSFKVGEYATVIIPAAGINQIMPIIEIETISEGTHMDVMLTLDKAPLTDAKMIVDMFRRISELEKPSVNNDVPTERYSVVTDNIGYTDRVTFKLN